MLLWFIIMLLNLEIFSTFNHCQWINLSLSHDCVQRASQVPPSLARLSRSSPTRAQLRSAARRNPAPWRPRNGWKMANLWSPAPAWCSLPTWALWPSTLCRKRTTENSSASSSTPSALMRPPTRWWSTVSVAFPFKFLQTIAPDLAGS